MKFGGGNSKRSSVDAPASTSTLPACRCYLITRFDRAELRIPLQFIPLEALCQNNYPTL